MPDESCRLCGGELVKCTICAECRKPVGMICAKCGSRTKEQVHDCCFILKFDETKQNSKIFLM